MIIVDSIEDAIGYLLEGYQFAKVSMDYKGMDNECLVSGLLMGLSKEVWWYVLVENEGGSVRGLVLNELFMQLYSLYYIGPGKQVSDMEIYYMKNNLCDIREMPRYLHKIDSWKESISSPSATTENLYG